MLRDIVEFEWRYHTRQPSFIAAALLFFLIGFALSATQFGPDNVPLTSPYLVMETYGFLSLFSLFAVAVFAANGVLRDDEHRMREIVFSTAVGRAPFLFGRFGGAFLATLTSVAVSAIGGIIGTLMPWVEPARVGTLDVRAYAWAFSTITIPNVFFAAALLFTVAVLTRSAVATYAAAVAGYFLYLICSALTNSPLMAQSKPGSGGGMLPSLLDPFGLTSFFDVTQYWTGAAKSTLFVPLAGVFLANRVLWVLASAAMLGVTLWRFSFRTGRVKKLPGDSPLTLALSPEGRGDWASLSSKSVRPSAWRSYFAASRMELRALFTKSLLLLLLLSMFLAVAEIRSDVLVGEYGSTSYPVTSLIIRAVDQQLLLIGLIIIVYFGAEIFWREQRFQFASILDSTPVSGSVMIAAKWTALAALIGMVLGSGVLAGIAVQLSKGHFQLQPQLYLSFFYFVGLPLLLYAAAAMLIHAVSPGKYAGMIFVLLFLILSRRVSIFGLEHDLWRFASAPPFRYTEMNGFGHQSVPFHWFMLHWSVLSLLFNIAAAALWRRIGAPLRDRLRSLRMPKRATAMLVALFAVTGGWIFFNTNIAEAYVTSSELADWKADYEKAYKQIERMPRPRIESVSSEVDLYPSEQRFRIAGRYGLVNDATTPVKSVYVTFRREARVTAISIPSARLASQDERFGMFRFDFQRPLAPGQKAELRFDVSFSASGFASGQQDDSVVANGSYLMSFRGFPTLGYRRSYELNDPRERRKRGLSGGGAATIEGDGSHAAVTGSDDEWVAFSATVSTDADQIAVAPGRLVSSWQRGNRRWFRYRANAPILNRFAIASARYAVAKRRHQGIDLELYYHPEHGANAKQMLDTAAASLDVMQSSFQAYPYTELRMVEIPGHWPYAGFALPGMVFLREDRAFLTDSRDETRPDLVGRRVAHEIAHQWFGHRVYSTNVEGGSMIVESLTKYAELRVMERMHGREHVRQLLEIELDRYLAGRAQESNAEVPLYRVDNQSYLFYNKGAVVLYGIRDLIGGQAMDSAIRTMMQNQRPTSVELWRHLRAAAADPQEAALIDQWLRDIVLYDLRIENANAVRRADGRYDVTIRVNAGKVRADGQGNEQAIPFAEPVEIAVNGEKAVLDSRAHPLRQGTNTLTLVVGSKPTEVTVDPWITRLDRKPQDNRAEVGE